MFPVAAARRALIGGQTGRERFQWPFSGSYMFRPGFQMLDVSWVLYVPAWMLFD